MVSGRSLAMVFALAVLPLTAYARERVRKPDDVAVDAHYAAYRRGSLARLTLGGDLDRLCSLPCRAYVPRGTRLVMETVDGSIELTVPRNVGPWMQVDAARSYGVRPFGWALIGVGAAMAFASIAWTFSRFAPWGPPPEKDYGPAYLAFAGAMTAGIGIGFTLSKSGIHLTSPEAIPIASPGTDYASPVRSRAEDADKRGGRFD